MPLWNEEAFPDRMEYRYDDQRLHPGTSSSPTSAAPPCGTAP
ncbi:hypothetical protein ACFQ0M_05620 [Kitasatospora aburaviensis]